MTGSQQTLRKDEIRLGTGDIAKVKGGETWVEVSPPITTDDQSLEQRAIEKRYEVNDIVTDAVNVTPIHLDDDTDEITAIDYTIGAFREAAAAGALVPESYLENPSHDIPDTEALIESITAAVNQHNVDGTELMNAFDVQHNYIQSQAFTEVVKPLVIAMATSPQVDARNADAQATAEALIAATDWDIPQPRT